MPWYLPWSESIKKRASRYLLQRYLGQFLEEKLTLDQLTVDLYNGIGSVSDVRLDVQALNELGEQQNFPVEFVDGSISEISVSIPWSSLLSESSYVEVTGLVLTIQPKQRADSGTSMFESMWSSSMTSSIQLAEECLKQGSSDSKDADQSHPLEGLELFAQTIDSILSKVKVKFTDTVIRLEHVPKDSSWGVGIEIRIKNMDYFDEAGTDIPGGESHSHASQGSRICELATFTVKKFNLEGITLYTDEFPSRARTFSRSVLTCSSSSSPDSRNSESNFGTAPVTPSSSSPSTQDAFPSEKIFQSNFSVEADPILFGKLAGRQEIRMKLKQSEGIVGPKVDLELNLGSLTTFLSARQLHILLELFHGLSTPDLEDTSNVPPRPRCVEKPMDLADFHRIEQELQQQLHPLSALRTKGLQNTQGWSTASLDDSDDEFLPMRGPMHDSLMSSTSSLEGSISSSASSSCSTSKSGSVVTNISQRSGSTASFATAGFSSTASHNAPSSLKKKSRKSSTMDSDPNTEVSHFHIRVSSLAIVLLHEDIITVCAENGESRIAHSSIQEMKATALDFFTELGFFAVSGYGNKDFEKAKDVFFKACQLNHIRMLAAPVIIEGSEKTTLAASCISGTMTAASLEILECLIDKKTPPQTVGVEYVELLKFTRPLNDNEERSSFPIGSQPDFRLQFKYTEKTLHHGQTRKFGQPHTDISMTLQPCVSEVDVSIVDRVTALLNPKHLCRRNPSNFAMGKDFVNQQTMFFEAVENSTLPDNKVDLRLSSSSLILKLRFPTPDMRPIHDMDRPPWWKRSVRKDFLTFECSDLCFHTVLDSHEVYRCYEFQCRNIHGLFQEADTDVSVPFIRACADDKNGNSLPNGGQGFGWPRIAIHIYPVIKLGDLEETAEIDVEESMRHSITEPLVKSAQKEPSPFSSKKVIHESDTPHSKSSQTAEAEGEELVIPGNRQEMAEFIEHASRNCRVQLEINLPCASMHLSSKHLYELIYNRINTDMFLWEPAAPKPPESTGTVHSIDLQANDTLYPAFSLCKSGIKYDSDSESEEGDGTHYSVYEQRQRHKRKQQLEKSSQTGQSKLCISLTISQGVLSLYAPVRDSSGNVIPGQHGEIEILFDEGSMFSVSRYKGKSGLGFVCLQVNQAGFFHNGLVTTPSESPPLKFVGSPPSAHLEPTFYRSDNGSLVKHCAPVGVGTSNSLDMLSVAIKIQEDDSTHSLKTFRVAAGLRGATLRHRMCAANHSWFNQIVDFFDVIDYPVAGYDPPGVITELHMHFWDCAIDYRPLHLPLKSVITVGSFSISSNIAAQTSSSTLRFTAEDAALFISDKTSMKQQSCSVDLRKDYVCVMDLGLFELSLRLCDKTNGQHSMNPRVDLRASNNVLHIRTCSDSGKALTELLTYFALDGDLMSVDNVSRGRSDSTISSGSGSSERILVNMEVGAVDSNENSIDDLTKSQVEHVHDLMEEAMKDANGSHSVGKKKSDSQESKKKGVQVFFFPDEQHQPVASRTFDDTELSQAIDDIDDDDNWEDDFCILDKEAGCGIVPKNGLPQIRNLIAESVRIVDNHFSIPLGKTDLLQAPKHYPAAVLRYTLREMTVVWHMYGGKDFATHPPPEVPKKQVKIEDKFRSGANSCPSSPPFTNYQFARSPSDTHIGAVVAFSKTTPSEISFGNAIPTYKSPKMKLSNSHLPWQSKGGPCRQQDVRLELQLNKVRFQHEVYPENTVEASRQVLLISDVEIRDRLASSQINKLLYQYSSEARPKQSHANMVVIKAVHVRPDPKLKVQECCLKVSLLPLRLNIDQDSLLFLFSFFTELSGGKNEEEDTSGQGQSSKHSTPTHQVPVMTVNMEKSSEAPPTEQQTLLIQLEEEVNRRRKTKTSSPSFNNTLRDRSPPSPIFFRSFIFAPEVPIRLDYHGKHVDMTHGPLAGLIMGLGQLNCSELHLKRLSYRHGLLGFDKLISYAMSEWVQDIKKNQLPSLLGGVGPMHALVQLFQGIRDLFWLPIEQYQKDGRIVRGIQRGTNSFTTSTAMAALELTNRVVQTIQSAAEMAYDMVSPGPSVRRKRHGPKGKRRRYNQPADIREGMANAYMLVKEGFSETAQTIAIVASEEHEQKGMSGAIGGVLRQIPPTIVKPIIFTSEATSNVLGGMRSQLVPDARREAAEKWRSED